MGESYCHVGIPARDKTMESIRRQREVRRLDAFEALLCTNKRDIVAAALNNGVDVTQYHTYYDLAQAIVDAQYPNLSDNPNA